MDNQPEEHTMVYVRHTPVDGWPCEICTRGDDNVYQVTLVSKNALINLISASADLLRAFEAEEARAYLLERARDMKELEENNDE